MRLSIATKIFIAFAFLVATFTGVVAFGVYRTQSLFNQIERLNRRIVPISLSLSDAQTDLKSFNLLLNERDPLVIRRTLQVARLVHSLPDRIQERIGRASEMLRTSRLDRYDAARAEDLRQLQDNLRELDRTASDFARRSRRFTDMVLEDESPGAERPDAARIDKLQSQLREDARRLGDRISALRQRIRAITDRALDRAHESERSSLYALGGLSAVALLLAVGVLVAVLRIVRPLGTLTDAAKRVGEGDYRPIEEVPDNWLGRDEITLLAEEFNSMARKLARRDEKLREQHRALLKSERLATVGRMTSAITHELRNPLSSINLNTEMLQESLIDHGIDRDDSEIMPLLETIIDEVDRLREITEEYLVYARLPSSELESQDLVAVVQDLVDFHRNDWEQRSVDLDLDIPEQRLEVMVDSSQLRQALLNVVENAVEASPEGGTVRVALRRDETTARIVIEDEGPGIDPEVRDELFEPFVTTKSEGTGLGLAMTQQIVDEHHGEIRVEERDDSGTRFVIEIPRGEEVETGPVVDEPELDSGSPSVLEEPAANPDASADASS